MDATVKDLEQIVEYLDDMISECEQDLAVYKRAREKMMNALVEKRMAPVITAS